MQDDKSTDNTSFSLRVFSVSAVLAQSPLKGDFPLSHFDGITYLAHNTDVTQAVCEQTVLSARSHYENVGRSEGRLLPLALSTRPNMGYRFELEDDSFKLFNVTR